MKELHLLRHAKSDWDDPGLDDFDRPLAKRGRRAAKRMARFLAQAGVQPDHVLCSAARRTRETHALIASELPAETPVAFERELYLAGSQALLRRLRRLPDELRSVMVIGHNPDLHELALGLASPEAEEHARLTAKFPTAALASLEIDIDHWRDLALGRHRLLRFVVPAELED